MGTITFIVFLVLGLNTLQASSDENKTLQFIHVVMRHGVRTPASTYPNDPYINNTFYPTGWGQITNEGKLQLYNVGKYLRERYDRFLGSHYSPDEQCCSCCYVRNRSVTISRRNNTADEYYTQSTGVDRTKVSMQLVNAGLWPPRGDQRWGPLDWQPVPVMAEKLEEDSLLLVRRPCPRYHIEKERVKKSPEVQNMLKQYETLFRELTEITGQKITDFEGVQDVYTTLLAEERFNLTLPEWTKDYYPDKMYYPTVKSFVLNAYNDKMNRYIGGVLLKKLIDDWTAKVAGTIKPRARKAILYGGHDGTIVNLLSTLKIWDEQFPSYAITILFELYKDNVTNDYGVEIYLRNSTVVPPFKLTVPGCDSFCPLTKLKNLTRDVIPQNWEEECKTDVEDFVIPELSGP